MIYLRARFYAPEMNRFSQKDTLRGSVTVGTSLNRYLYCQNDPVNFMDSNGLRMVAVNVADGGGSGRDNSGYARTTASKPTSSNKPIQSGNMNQANARQSTAQAQFDAKRALDFANNVAPGSPQARAAQQAYQQTMNYATIANRTNNPYMTQQAIQSSRSGVGAANSLASNSSRKSSATGNYSSQPSSFTRETPAVQNIKTDSNSCSGRGLYGYGEIVNNGVSYPVYVPKNGDSYQQNGWITTSEVKLKYNLKLDLYVLLLGELEGTSGNQVNAGYYVVSDGQASSRIGGSVALLANLLNSAQGSLSSEWITMVFQESDEQHRAIILAGSSNVSKNNNAYADGKPHYMGMDNAGIVSSLMVADLYSSLSNDSAKWYEQYDIRYT